MPKYTVSYTTDEKPAAFTLPADAKVEKISALPLTIDNGIGRKIRVEKNFLSMEETGYAVYQADVSAKLRDEHKIQLADALYEAAGREVPSEPAVKTALPFHVSSEFGKDVTVRHHFGSGDYVLAIGGDRDVVLSKATAKKLAAALTS